MPNKLEYSQLVPGKLVSWRNRPFKVLSLGKDKENFVTFAPVATGIEHRLYEHHLQGSDPIFELQFEDVRGHVYVMALSKHPKPEQGKDANQDARFNHFWLELVSCGLVQPNHQEEFFSEFDASLGPHRRSLAAVGMLCGIVTKGVSTDKLRQQFFELASKAT